jgi:predicted nucleic acid-binding protein
VSIPYLYDAGALIAIDNNDRRMWARHSLALDDGRDIYTPSIVISQAWRDARRQVRLGKFLTGCRIAPVDTEIAKAAGILCGRAGTTDIVDATVVVMAAALGAIIWTSDPDDIRTLVDAQGIKPVPVIRTV